MLPGAEIEKPSALEKFASDAARSKPARVVPPETKAANAAADEVLDHYEFKVHKRKISHWVSDSPVINPDFTLLKMLAYIAFWLVLAAVIAAAVVFLMRNRHLLGLPQLVQRK